MRILLVEDDRMIGVDLSEALRTDGHSVDWVTDGLAAELALQATRFDLALLDLGLPRKAGREVLRALRHRDDATPVIVITARDALEDRVEGLDLGADDYLVKPFELAELKARMRAVARRHAGRARPRLSNGTLTVDPATREVWVEGREVTLSAKEYAVLYALLERPGAILSRRQIEERVYGWNEEVESNAVDVLIHYLRRKLGAGAIKNVRGAGWMVPKSGA
ncbi:MAG: response regulator transcription factor [Betaproteobacteria bacterium]|nr:response regulator transcription factor [Betaproteobacteria bacterium]